MEKEIAYLIKHYGSLDAAAEALGIKPRTLKGYRGKEIPIPPWMQNLLRREVELIKIKARVLSSEGHAA